LKNSSVLFYLNVSIDSWTRIRDFLIPVCWVYDTKSIRNVILICSSNARARTHARTNAHAHNIWAGYVLFIV